MLINRVKDLAVAERLPVYLEGTLNAVPMYRKLGWEVVGQVELMLPRAPGEPATERYQEMCMIWRPTAMEM